MGTDCRFLRELPAFGDIDATILGEIAEAGAFVDLPADAAVFQAGDAPEHLHVLLRGMVALTAASAGGDRAVIEVLGALDQFILASVLLGAPYLMSARTLQPARLFRIPAAPLRRLIGAEPSVALAMTHSLAQQQRLLVRQVADLKLRSVAQRLGCYLISLLGEPPHGREIRLPYGKRLLAARLGTTPEHLSRAFAVLRRYGVTTRGSRVGVSDPAELSAFAGMDGPAP